MRVLAAILVIAGLFGAGCESVESPPRPAPSVTPRGVSRIDPNPNRPFEPANVLEIPAGLPGDGIDLRNAFIAKQSDVWVVNSGQVTRILRDDTKPPRHQRFVVDLGPGTVLVAHNTDLAPRVPVKRGDMVAFRGEYIWSEQGGTVHWTHRDKRDRSAGGWILWRGQTFR